MSKEVAVADASGVCLKFAYDPGYSLIILDATLKADAGFVRFLILLSYIK